jgi:OOP family OmpA-OmpF porin
MKHLVYLGIALAAAQAATAQEDSRGGYMGFAFGTFIYEETDAELGFEIVDDSTTAYRILGGYRFNDHFAVEGGWGATDDLKESLTASLPLIGDITLDTKADYQAFSVRALGIIPLRKVSLIGGIGYYDAELNATLSVAGFGAEDYVVDTDGATLMTGLEVDLSRMHLRAEIEWFDSEPGVEAWDASLGLVFRF